ncbi:hypothetical protein GCM10028833_21310 [Glycomyces tarimensis]
MDAVWPGAVRPMAMVATTTMRGPENRSGAVRGAVAITWAAPGRSRVRSGLAGRLGKPVPRLERYRRSGPHQFPAPRANVAELTGPAGSRERARAPGRPSTIRREDTKPIVERW